MISIFLNLLKIILWPGEGIGSGNKTPWSSPNILKITFSWLGIYLVTVNLWLFSWTPTKLAHTVSDFLCVIFLWDEIVWSFKICHSVDIHPPATSLVMYFCLILFWLHWVFIPAQELLLSWPKGFLLWSVGSRVQSMGSVVAGLRAHVMRGLASCGGQV